MIISVRQLRGLFKKGYIKLDEQNEKLEDDTEVVVNTDYLISPEVYDKFRERIVCPGCRMKYIDGRITITEIPIVRHEVAKDYYILYFS